MQHNRFLAQICFLLSELRDLFLNNNVRLRPPSTQVQNSLCVRVQRIIKWEILEQKGESVKNKWAGRGLLLV
jgi:hypothetical protein